MLLHKKKMCTSFAAKHTLNYGTPGDGSSCGISQVGMMVVVMVGYYGLVMVVVGAAVVMVAVMIR